MLLPRVSVQLLCLVSVKLLAPNQVTSLSHVLVFICLIIYGLISLFSSRRAEMLDPEILVTRKVSSLAFSDAGNNALCKWRAAGRGRSTKQNSCYNILSMDQELVKYFRYDFFAWTYHTDVPSDLLMDPLVSLVTSQGKCNWSELW